MAVKNVGIKVRNNGGIMNKESYEIIKQYFGTKFIQYIIDYDGELNSWTTFEELELNNNQIKALAYLDDIQKKCRLSHLNKENFGDGFKSGIKQVEPSIFNNLRKSCGGMFPQVEKGDPIFEFLSNLMIQHYAHLLIKQKEKLFSFHSSFFETIDLEIFESLLSQDILSDLMCKENGLNHAFQFNLSDGTQIYRDIHSFFGIEIIIWRAFQNSCNQMNYTLENCLNELKLLLKNLRELAKGKQTTFSYFIGLSWIYLEKNIEMEDILIHPLDSTDNPGLYTSLIANHENEMEVEGVFIHPSDSTITNHENENSRLLGAIARIQVPIKVIGKGEKRVSRTVLPSKEISHFIKKINLSLFFSLNKNRGIILTFGESGFVLKRPGGYCFNSSPFRSLNILENNDFDTFSSWLKK